MTVFWGVPCERSIGDLAFNNLLDVAGYCAQKGYRRLRVPYMAIDIARNKLTNVFCQLARDPQDVLVMLDDDHLHPYSIVEALAQREVGVVAAASNRRLPPFLPVFFRLTDAGERALPTQLGKGLEQGVFVGTGALAVKRWVFTRLEQQFQPPFWRNEYPTGGRLVREDEYFCELLNRAGIPMFVDWDTHSPHLGQGKVTWASYAAWLDTLGAVDVMPQAAGEANPFELPTLLPTSS